MQTSKGVVVVTKIAIRVLLPLAFITSVVLFAWPEFAGTSNSYFDINNGRLKVECVSFGRIYRKTIGQTEYTKLLEKSGFNELPEEWKPANSQELGIRQFLDVQRVHHEYAKTPTDAMTFAQWLSLQENMSEEEERAQVAKFRSLLQEGTPEQIHEYVIALERGEKR